VAGRKNGRITENMNNVFRFREFPVYIEARIFRHDLKSFLKKKFPPEEKYCLLSQALRVMDSILLNIAEGSERYTDLDFSRFLNMATTSVNEVVAILDAAVDDKYITEEERLFYSNKAENVYRQLRAFSLKVRHGTKTT
jgi:four helix bundle protein